ncbi:MAG TPA: hypothetical protein VH592_06490 [Gemmataceae bacterium]|jgi:hypothetical protein
MYRTVGGILVLLLALPAVGYQEKNDEKPATPEQQYKALLKEQSDAMKAYEDAAGKAKTQQERNKAFAEKYPKPEKAAPKFLELAEKNPKDPVAVDALIWVVTHTDTTGEDSPRDKALNILLRDHVKSDKLVPICQNLIYSYGETETKLLHAILDKNSSKDVQTEACLALAQQLGRAALMLRLMEDQPEMASRLEQIVGKEQLEDLRIKGPAKLAEESAHYYKDFASKYAPGMKADKLIQLCQNLGQSGDGGAEPLLRMLEEKDRRRDVQGVACLALAQSLKTLVEYMPESKEKEAEKMRKESETMFERVVNKYADVKLPFGGAIGEQAKTSLFELRYLSIGKEAPEIAGEDADSKKFKLSDYRGKVVLVDFWGNW